MARLQLQDAKPEGEPDEILQFDSDMPQHLALQTPAGKRAAEAAGSGIKEAEAAIKKLKATVQVRGKTTPRG